MKINAFRTFFFFLITFSNYIITSSEKEKTRVEELAEIESFTFDLENSAPGPNSGGGTIKALNVGNFPALARLGISYNLVELMPCGINLPHVHPRGTELSMILSGKLQFGFVEENGGRGAHLSTLTKGQVIVIPQGYIHFAQNFECENASFIAAFPSEDPGTVTISNRGFELPDEALEATYILSESKINSIRSKLPLSPAKGADECLKRCHLIY